MNVGILIFDNAEVLDFAGPFEVFSVSSEINGNELFTVFTVAKNDHPVITVNGLSVNPEYTFENCPEIDLLIISGGEGTRSIMKDPETLNWVNKIHHTTLYTASICSGSVILGALGLLDHKKYCTHREVYEQMEEIVPSGIPQKDKRYIQEGKIFTSGGISAGIDLSFHIVELLFGSQVAKKTAAYMEYDLN